MRLVLRDIVLKQGDDTVLNGAGYTFWQGNVYGIMGDNAISRSALLDCINCETEFDGTIELDCGGKDCMKPSMIGQLLLEPAFPEFLTAAEFLKYFIDINKKNIAEPKSIEEYLARVELLDRAELRMIREFTYEEKVRLQFLCFLIVAPPVVIINGINVSNVDFLKDIKGYVDEIKEQSIVILSSDNPGMAKYMCDEIVYIENGCIHGGM